MVLPAEGGVIMNKVFTELIAKMLGAPSEQVEQALIEVKNKMQAQDNKPITKEQLIGMWLDEKGSISLSEQVALRFAYDKLSSYLQTKED